MNTLIVTKLVKTEVLPPTNTAKIFANVPMVVATASSEARVGLVDIVLEVRGVVQV